MGILTCMSKTFTHINISGLKMSMGSVCNLDSSFLVEVTGINLGTNLRIAHLTCYFSLGFVWRIFTCTMVPLHAVWNFVSASLQVPYHASAGHFGCVHLWLLDCRPWFAMISLTWFFDHKYSQESSIQGSWSSFLQVMASWSFFSMLRCFYLALQSHATYSTYLLTSGFQQPGNVVCKNFPQKAVESP